MADILIGEFDNNDLSLYGYTNSTDDSDYIYGKLNKVESPLDAVVSEYNEDTSDFIYGQLNKQVELKEYQGLISDTAKVTVNNVDDKIKVDFLKTAKPLIIKQDGEILGVFDGSEEKEITIPLIDSSKFATKEDYENQQKDLLILGNNFNTLQTEVNDALIDFNLKLTANTEAVNNHTILINNLIEFKASKEELESEALIRLNKDNELTQLINNEVIRATNKESELQNSLSTLDNKLDNNITELNNKIDLGLANKLDLASANVDLLKNVNIEVSGDTAYLNRNTFNLSTGNEIQLPSAQIISAASTTNSGLMTAEDVKEIQSLRQAVTLLQGVNIRLLYSTKNNPSASEIKQFVIDSGFAWDEATGNWYHIAVVIKDTNHIWRYYENNDDWIDAGQDLVNQFTNSIAGIIKGSAEDGKIYAENDGTGSVFGWDALKSTVSDNSTNIDTLNNTKQNIIDNSLTTESKTIVDSINEVNSNLGLTNTNIDNIINGTQIVNHATNADNFTENGSIKATFDLKANESEAGNKLDIDLNSDYELSIKLLNKNNEELSSKILTLPFLDNIIDVNYQDHVLYLIKRSGESISIDLSDLMNIYNAGKGLELVDNTFNIKIDPVSTNTLSVSESGLKITDVEIKPASKTNLGGIRAWIEDDYLCIFTSKLSSFTNTYDSANKTLNILSAGNATYSNGVLSLN